MITVKFTRVKLRPKPNQERVQQSHCALNMGTTSAYATGTTDGEAQAAARLLMSVHVHAMSKQDALAYKPTYVGIPPHYRLARGVS